jgi:hypothetical protein
VARTTLIRWLLIACCVTLAAFFGLAWALDEDGDVGVTPCPAGEPSCAPDELARALPCVDTQPSRCGHRAQPRLDAWGLLAGVPGGLCLLI